MPLRNVCDFVRDHARELALVLGIEQQSAVHADEAAGQRECVDRVVPDDEEVEALRAVRRLARQALADRADVLGDLGVFEDLILVAQAAHDHAADLYSSSMLSVACAAVPISGSWSSISGSICWGEQGRLA